MGADNTLVQGAYAAAGGGIDTNPRNAWRRAGWNIASSFAGMISPLIQAKSEKFNEWRDQQLSERSRDGLTNKAYLDLEKQYKLKKIRYMFAGPAEQTMILGEMVKDKEEITQFNNLKNEVAIKGGDQEAGFANHNEFLGSRTLESITAGLSGTPKRNKEGQLGIMVWDNEEGKEQFKTFPEVKRIISDMSRDVNTSEKVDGLMANTTQQSLGESFNSNFYDYRSNYSGIHNNIVKNGDLETLNEYENTPGRIFKNDFKEMLMNNEYERLGVTIEGSSKEDFLGLGRRDDKRLQKTIERLDPNTDGDPNKISEADAEAIYQAMKKNKRLNQQLLTTYLTNMSEKQWMSVRWDRKDAPSKEEFNTQLKKKNGIYDDHDSVWDYKMENGKWKTRRKDNQKSGWIDISDNEEATKKLNEKYPEALTNDIVWQIDEDASINTQTGEVSSKLQSKKQEEKDTKLFTGEEGSNLRELINTKFGRGVSFSDSDFQGFLDKHPKVKEILGDENTSDEEKFNLMIDSDFMDLPMFDELNKKLNKYISGQTQF
tara:strand:+ start:440 stop:2068 length:1629 start_codon:yes stop_codon:yes gene_type:complete